MNFPVWVWAVTLVALLGLIAADLLIVGRRPHAVGVKEAGLWVAFYVALAAIFGGLLFAFAGSTSGAEFFAGYVTEYSLSVDNLFVFVIIMSRFAVPREHQHRVLYIGILISLVLRAICIAAGVAVLAAFNWVFYLFGAFLIYTAIKVARDAGDDSEDDDGSGMIRALQRFVPTTDTYDGGKMVTRVDGKRMFTPLLLVVAALGLANVIFALDSMPAIFGLTKDGFIIFTANAFALMGLRQLYFVIGGLLDRLIYLSYGLAVILGFIGLKLIIEALHGSHVEEIHFAVPDIGIAASLGFIVLTLAITTVASLARSRTKRQDQPAPEPVTTGAEAE
ncbi:TerC/Alx family metal homeostasis membrane protein [Saccharopolyspora sp. ID03-671]|uniref:TerC/Alx family metal homeostasis membrane protein n=1 Tax=Saccharopolyspora sp. ID03-671 TaxID=3073066 RepID=UPI00324A4CF8